MFFPRLRNQAKWAFVFLIVIFAGGFVFLGVGSGGLDLGQLLRDAFGQQSASTGSVSEAQKAVKERPFNVPARRKLAETLEKKGRVDESIAAWQAYIRLQPKDFATRRHVADLQRSEAEQFLNAARLAAAQQAEASAGTFFGADKLSQNLGQDPITGAVTSKANTALQTASAKFQSAAAQAIASYQGIVRQRPKDEQAVFALAQAADSLLQTQVAINAYKKMLTFDLDASTKAQIRARINQLKQHSGAG